VYHCWQQVRFEYTTVSANTHSLSSQDHHFFDLFFQISQVSEQEGNELAAQWNCPSVEASAKHNENISKFVL
jgi:hypothetical protein